MAHRNARLTVYGRRLIVQRVRGEGWAVAHAAKAMGISRQCAHRWLARWDADGEAGLWDRSSRPHRSPARSCPEVEARVVEARRRRRVGPDQLSDELEIPARTISRILRRHQVPYLRECDPLTGEVIRASKTTAVRYERDRPGELIHVDVIPEGAGPVNRGVSLGFLVLVPCGGEYGASKQPAVGPGGRVGWVKGGWGDPPGWAGDGGPSPVPRRCGVGSPGWGAGHPFAAVEGAWSGAAAAEGAQSSGRPRLDGGHDRPRARLPAASQPVHAAASRQRM